MRSVTGGRPAERGASEHEPPRSRAPGTRVCGRACPGGSRDAAGVDGEGPRLGGPGRPACGADLGYLSRSASFLYALHGAMVLFISFDLLRYWRLVTFLATAALVHGAVMLGIDLAEGMPAWWTVVEGPAFAATGGVVLLLQYLAGRGRGRA